MKAHKIPLMIGCLTLVAACCAVQKQKSEALGGKDPAAEYVVIFGPNSAPINLKSRTQFLAALDHASWRRGIVFFNPPEPGLSPDAGSGSDATPVRTWTISRESATSPNTQQVTQRVGFGPGQKPELQKLLDQIKE